MEDLFFISPTLPSPLSLPPSRSPTRDSPLHTPHSSTRQRRKRKNSHNKLRRAQDRSSISPSPPPPSPLLPSSPTTTNTSPLPPFSPLSQENTPKVPPDSTPSSAPPSSAPPSSTPRSGQGKRASLREMVGGAGGGSSGAGGKGNKEETFQKRLVDSYSGEEGVEKGREGGGGMEGGWRRKGESVPTRRLTNGVADKVSSQQRQGPWGGGPSKTSQSSSSPEQPAPPTQPSPPKPAWSRGMSVWRYESLTTSICTHCLASWLCVQ